MYNWVWASLRPRGTFPKKRRAGGVRRLPKKDGIVSC